MTISHFKDLKIQRILFFVVENMSFAVVFNGEFRAIPIQREGGYQRQSVERH